MNAFLKVAALAFGMGGALVAVPASAQSYDDDYYGAYGDAYDGAYDDAYDAYADAGYGGYCDEYGCPEDYYDLPFYDGEIYYDGSWLNGPFYYRDWGGRRQYWLHGSWRSAQYRGGNFRPALGRDWYRNRGNVARGWNGWNGGRSGYQNRSSQNRSNWSQQNGNRGSFNYGGRSWQGQSQGYGQRNYQRSYDQNRNVGGRSAFRDQSQPAPQVQQQSQPSPQNWRGRGDFGRWSGQQSGQQAQQQSQAQRSYPDRSGRISGGEGRRGGDGGERHRGRDR